MRKIFIILTLVIFSSACTSQAVESKKIQTGADQTTEYLPLLEEKKIGLCVNHTSRIGTTHLVDSLLALGIEVGKVFSPEHGFQGTADAGEKIQDQKTAEFEIISLYGRTKKPTSQQMHDIELIVFDIQDVGARFYTYISTMHYIMEACAENQVPLIILDRPNPNGSYVDGPVLDTAYQSFVGMHPIPVVHGLTVGELANMINGEGWLKNGLKCDITVIPVQNWKHSDPYLLPVKPSPNLPNDRSVKLYPSLCLFEGTVISVGRGTDYPFQVIGHPDYPIEDFYFIPESKEGAKYPKWEGKKCYGMSFVDQTVTKKFTLNHLIDFYEQLKNKIEKPFFNDYFDTLAGTDQLRKQIENGWSEESIRSSWEKELEAFRLLRKTYLLYPD